MSDGAVVFRGKTVPAHPIQLRRGTAAKWAEVNPILAEGEIGLELDTGKEKVGDGVTRWNDLPYHGSAGAINISAGASSVSRSDFTFSNSNGVSFGVNAGGQITASVFTNYQSTGPYLTTAARSQDSSRYAGTTAGATGASVTLNTAGIAISVVPGAAGIKVSAGTLSSVRSDLTFSNSGGVTFGLETNGAITASVATNYQSQGAYLTTAALSQDSSKYAGTNGAITGGSITVNTSGVSVNLPAYLTTAMASDAATISNLRVSAGTTSNLLSAITFSNSNGVTFGLDGSTLTATVKTDYQSSGAYLTTAMQSNAATISNIKVSAGANSSNVSAITFSNGSGVSFGYDGTNITATVKTDYQTSGAYLTTAALSGDTSKYAGVNGAITGGSITVNTSGVSVNLPAYLTTADLSANSSKYVQNWKLTGNTAGTTSSAQGTDLWLAGGNGVTVSGNSNSITFSVATNYQSQGAYLTTAALSGDTSKYAGVNGAITGGSITVNTSGVSVNLPAYLTTADLSANSSKYIQEWAFAGNNTAGTTSSAQGTRLYLSGGNNITLSGNSNTIVLSVGAGGGGAGTNTSVATTAGTDITLGVNTSGVTIGYPKWITTAALSGDTSKYAGINSGATNCSVTVNTSGVSVSVATAATSSMVGSSGLSVSTNGSTITVYNAAYIGYLEPYPMTNTANFAPGAGSWYFAPFVAPGNMSGGRINFLFSNTSTAGIARDITGGSYVSSSSGGKNQSYSYSFVAALYSQGTGTNSTRLESFWSNSFSFGLSHKLVVSQSGANSSISITVSQSISYISEIGSDGAYTLNQFASNNNSGCAGTSTASNQMDSVGLSIRNMLSDQLIQPVGFNTTITAGAYWMACWWSSTRSSQTSGTSFAGASALDFSQKSQVGISRLLLEASYRNWASTATTARSHIMPYGVYTAVSAVPPQYVNFSSDLSSLGSAWVPYFNFQNQGITK